jgi:heparosan-N-sulfate-glucuronate 5-epimerase
MRLNINRKNLKKFIIVSFPRLFAWRTRKIYSRNEYAVNDLSIYQTSEITYNPNGIYVTMFSTPPKHYWKIIEARIFDRNGIPLNKLDGKIYYHPVSIIQYGLTEYGYWFTTKKDEHRQHAMNVAEWLVKTQNTNGTWQYTFNYYHEPTGYLIEAPWASAMAQGEGISLLTRIYNITNEKKYLDAAIKATILLDIPIEKGGLCADLFGYTVYEEYPTSPPSFTLNGFCFCAFGLYDLCQLTDDQRIHNLWREAQKTLRFMIPLYDNDICSSYCLSHVFARKAEKIQSEKYHIIHISLLQNLQSIMPDITFVRYIKKWADEFGVHV